MKTRALNAGSHFGLKQPAGPRLKNSLTLLLWLGLLGSLGLEVYLLDRATVAHDYYTNKLAVRDHQGSLYTDTPLVSSTELSRGETRKGTGKYASTYRVEVKDEKWKTLASAS